MKTLLIVLALALLPNVAASQDCDDLMRSGASIISSETHNAIVLTEKLVRTGGVGVNLRAIRLRVLKNEFPRADVEVTVRRMLRAYCEVVRDDQQLGNTEKMARVQAAVKEMTRAVEGPAELARTNSTIRSGRAHRREQATLQVAILVVDEAPASTEVAFIKEAPSFVNDSNKYFVVVGSASSANEAIELMHRLKAKAPQYDFVVYQPYAGNRSYGVMMATWVSRDVALKALAGARTAVARDAYLWSCRSTGESC